VERILFKRQSGLMKQKVIVREKMTEINGKCNDINNANEMK
jgi:hypothetical protein